MRPAKRNSVRSAAAAEREPKRRQPSPSLSRAEAGTAVLHGNRETRPSQPAPAAVAQALGPTLSFTQGKTDAQSSRLKQRPRKSTASASSLLRRHMDTSNVSKATQTQGPSMAFAAKHESGSSEPSIRGDQSHTPMDTDANAGGPSARPTSSAQAEAAFKLHAASMSSSSRAANTAIPASGLLARPLQPSDAPNRTGAAHLPDQASDEHAQAQVPHAQSQQPLRGPAKDFPAARRHSAWGPAVRVPNSGKPPAPRWSIGSAAAAGTRRRAVSDAVAPVVPGKALADTVPALEASQRPSVRFGSRAAAGPPAAPSTRLMGSKRRASTAGNDPQSTMAASSTANASDLSQAPPAAAAASASAATHDSHEGPGSASSRVPGPALNAAPKMQHCATAAQAPPVEATPKRRRSLAAPASPRRSKSPNPMQSASTLNTATASAHQNPSEGSAKPAQNASNDPVMQADSISKPAAEQSLAAKPSIPSGSAEASTNTAVPVQPMALGLARPTRSSSARAQSRRSASSTRSTGSAAQKSASTGRKSSRPPSRAPAAPPAPPKHVQHEAKQVQSEVKAPQWIFSTSTQSKASAGSKQAARPLQPRAKKPSSQHEASPAASQADAGPPHLEAAASVSMEVENDHAHVPDVRPDVQPDLMSEVFVDPQKAFIELAPPTPGMDMPAVVVCPTVRRKPGPAKHQMLEQSAAATSFQPAADELMAEADLANEDQITYAPAQQALTGFGSETAAVSSDILPEASSPEILPAALQPDSKPLSTPVPASRDHLPEAVLQSEGSSMGHLTADPTLSPMEQEVFEITTGSNDEQTAANGQCAPVVDVPEEVVPQQHAGTAGPVEESAINPLQPESNQEAQQMTHVHEQTTESSMRSAPVTMQGADAEFGQANAESTAAMGNEGSAAEADEEAEAPTTPIPMLYSNAAFLASPGGRVALSPRQTGSPLLGPLLAASPQKGQSDWSVEAHQASSQGSLDDAHSAFINPAFLDARRDDEALSTPQALMRSPPAAVPMTRLLAPLDRTSSQDSPAGSAGESSGSPVKVTISYLMDDASLLCLCKVHLNSEHTTDLI